MDLVIDALWGILTDSWWAYQINRDCRERERGSGSQRLVKGGGKEWPMGVRGS